MAITEFHKPKESQSMSTYVDQYVPMPWEVMQKAAQGRQDIADENLVKSDNLLKALEVPVREQDRADHRAYVDNVRSQIDTVIDSYNGDASLASKDLRGIIREQQSSLSGGNLANWKAEKEALDAYDAKEKKLLESGKISAETYEAKKRQEYDLYSQSKGQNPYGRFSGTVATEEQDINQYLRDNASEIKATARKLGYWDLQPRGDGSWVSKTTTGTKVLSKDEIMDVLRGVTSSDPRIQAQLDQSFELTPYGVSPIDLDAMMSPIAEMYNINDLEQTQDIKAAPNAGGSGSRVNTDTGYSQYDTVGRNTSINYDDLRGKSDLLDSEIKTLQTDIFNFDPKNEAERDILNDMQNELGNKEHEKDNVKSTLASLAEGGGYDWDEAYESFKLDYAKEKEGIDFVDYKDKKSLETLKKKYEDDTPTMEDFRESVLEGGFISQTPVGMQGIDHNSPEFRDRGFEGNMLNSYIEEFNNTINENKDKKIATEDKVITTGSKTYGKKFVNTLKSAINDASPEFKLTADGSVFNKENIVDKYEEFLGPDFDWNKDAEVVMLNQFHNGKPQFQVNLKQSDGNILPINIVPDTGAGIMKDVGEVGFEMVDNAETSFRTKDKIDQNKRMGYNFIASKSFPNVMKSRLNAKPYNQPYDVKISNKARMEDGVRLRVIPRKHGSRRKYEAILVYPDGRTETVNQDKAFLYNNPEEINVALGKRFYNETKRK